MSHRICLQPGKPNKTAATHSTTGERNEAKNEAHPTSRHLSPHFLDLSRLLQAPHLLSYHWQHNASSHIQVSRWGPSTWFLWISTNYLRVVGTYRRTCEWVLIARPRLDLCQDGSWREVYYSLKFLYSPKTEYYATGPFTAVWAWLIQMTGALHEWFKNFSLDMSQSVFFSSWCILIDPWFDLPLLGRGKYRHRVAMDCSDSHILRPHQSAQVNPTVN